MHRGLGARLTAFAGWEMPLRYTGETEEHLAVRNSCGLFDVSHMGEIELSGAGAARAAERLTTNDTEKLEDGRCQYTLICNPRGGVIDDTILYRFSPKRFIFCVNASNTEKVFGWIRDNAGDDVAAEDVSASFAQLALQGPLSAALLSPLSETDPSLIRHFHFVETRVSGVEVLVSRTGYTGEDGFEFYTSPEGAVELWQGLMDAGSEFDLRPVGLAARDTLRVEMGYPLYGSELSEDTTPIEAGLSRFVKLDGEDFIGREALRGEAARGPARRLAGFEMAGPGIPRRGYAILKGERRVGEVTSGAFLTGSRRAVGMGLVEPSLTVPGTALAIEIRKRQAKAVVVTMPFYQRQAAATAV